MKTKYKSILSTMKLVSFLSVIFLSIVFGCRDDPLYSFGSYRQGRKEYTRTCSWIIKNKNKATKRRDDWCGLTIKNKVVKDACPMACLACTTSTLDPISISTKMSLSVKRNLPTRSPKLLKTSTLLTSPSPLPSSIPSYSHCESAEFIGTLVYVFMNQYNICFKIEMYVGGNMYLDIDTTNTECTPSSTQDTNLALFSSLTRITDKAVIFEAQKPLWSGELSFKINTNSKTTDKILSDITFNSEEGTFTGALIVPACFTPSLYPSTIPSSIPSISPVPSSILSPLPSIYPTSLPTISPSIFLSKPPSIMIPSSKPSSNPSLQPRCDVDELLGKAYFFGIIDSGNGYSFCFKVDFFSGGSFSLDPYNIDCNEANSNPQAAISYFASFSDKAIIFEPGVLGIAGWDGVFEFVKEDSKDFGLDSLSINGLNRTFRATLKIPSCSSPSTPPSTSPSQIPSNKPTMIPSMN